MKMKKEYKAAEIEIMEIKGEDIVCASGGGEDRTPDDPWD